MVLLQEGQLLREALHLHLQVGASQAQLVQDLPEAADVGLHGLPEVQLVLIPGRGGRKTVQHTSQGTCMLTCSRKSFSSELSGPLVKKNMSLVLILVMANIVYDKNFILNLSLFLSGGMMVFKVYIWDVCEFRS